MFKAPSTSLRAALTASTSRRLLHASSSRAALSIPSSMIASEQPSGMSMSPILDIFDAPVMLGESRKLYNRSKKLAAAPMDSMTIDVSSDRDQSLVYSSLPPPIVFDKPARPRGHIIRRNTSTRLSPPFSRMQHSSSMSSAEEPLCELFDGPARKIPRAEQKSSQSTLVQYLLLAGLAGTVGWTAAHENTTSAPSSKTYRKSDQ